jgi:small subunit ribosomal protein S6
LKYETMLVASAKLDDEAAVALVGKFKKLIEDNGTIEAVDEWGKRRLAYPINKEELGVYTLIYFTSEADFPAELRRVYGITDGVLRSIVIAREENDEIVLRGGAPKAETGPEEAKEEPAAEQAEVKAEEPAAAAEEALAEVEEIAEAAPEVSEEAEQAVEDAAEEKEEASE